MYKAILVEDEAAVREGIAGRLDWEAQGFSLVAACENGKAALAALEAEPVHLVITDINMPQMDGLQLAGEIQRRWPDTLVVILTGFADFNYAQQAIRYQVQDYMLKPVTARQLRQLLDKLRVQLDTAAQKKSGAHGMDDASRHLLGRSFARLAAGEPAEAEFSALLQPLPLPETGPYHVLLAGPAREGETVRWALESWAEEARGVPGTVVFSLDSGLLVCLSGSSSQSRLPALPAAELLAASGNAQDRAALPAACLQANERMQRLYSLPPGGGTGPDEEARTSPPASQSAARRAIVSAVKLLEEHKTQELLQAFFLQLQQEYRTRARVVIQLEKLVMQLAEYGEEARLSTPEELDSVLGGIRRSRHLDEAREAVEGYLRGMLQQGRSRSDTAGAQAGLAIEYIRQHYADPDLSLQDLTGYFSVSTSHFSAMFKTATGATFLEYLTQVRIQKAQELLVSTDLKNYEIAEQVGYDDPGYFGTIFKRITGLAPAAYRKSRR